ncbi:MAG: death domain-containing protein [Proteobacteria bacterium]|nr:death domain-containing protein [Pseudomonadota bacterium]
MGAVGVHLSMTIYGKTKFQKTGSVLCEVRKTHSSQLSINQGHLSLIQPTMAVPTYDELLAHYNVEKSIMKQTFDDEHLREFSLALDTLETLAKFLGIPNSDITAIKNQGCAIEQRMKMLECWKQRCGSMATYEAMIKALLKINRTDLAEKVITLRQSSNAINTLATATISRSLSSPRESSLTSPTFPASSSGKDEASLQAAMSSLSLSATPNEYPTQDVIPTLRELEEEFYGLVVFIEQILESSQVSLDTITRRFRMLPQYVRRQYETDV